MIINYEFITVLILSCIIADIVTYRWFATKEIEQNLLKKITTKNSFSSRGMIHFGHHDFICKRIGITSRWYIHDEDGNKAIFILSKFNKVLDRKYKELRIIEKKINLCKPNLFQKLIYKLRIKKDPRYLA